MDLRIAAIRDLKIEPDKDDANVRAVTLTVKATLLPEDTGELATYVGKAVVVALDLFQAELPRAAKPRNGHDPLFGAGDTARLYPSRDEG